MTLMMIDVRLVIVEDQSLFREELAYMLGAPRCRAKVLMLTSSEEQDHVVAAFDAGARGYVTPGLSPRASTTPIWQPNRHGCGLLRCEAADPPSGNCQRSRGVLSSR